MKRVVERGLVVLSLRRTACLGLCAWALALGLFAWFADTSAGAEIGALHDEVRAGLARQAVWTVFLLGVLPVVVVRAVTKAAPWHYGDAPWLATRAVSNTAIAISTWAGACLGGLGLTLAFALVAEVRGGSSEAPQVQCGALELPAGRGFAANVPLVWNASLSAPVTASDEWARIELGLGPGAGAACEVRWRARGRARGEEVIAEGRIGNRGTLAVRLPRGETDIEFELSTTSEEARVYVLSERADVWSQSSSPHAASYALGLRIALSVCVWIALALLFACFVSGSTATLGVLALWIPLWFSSGSLTQELVRSVPGADLFDALAIVGDGRAPSPLGVEVVIATFAIVVIALGLCALGLRTWRVSR